MSPALLDAHRRGEERRAEGKTEKNLPAPEIDPAVDFVDNPEVDSYKVGQYQRALVLKILQKYGVDPYDLVARMWSGIVDDLVHPEVIGTTYPAGGYEDGERRIQLTKLFFLMSMWLMKGGDYLDEIIEMVNCMHLNASVVRETDDGTGVKVNDQKLRGFMYVVSSLIERMRDGFRSEKRLGEKAVEKDSEEYKKIGQALYDFWYQVGSWVGLDKRPKDLDAHDRFIAAEEHGPNGIFWDVDGTERQDGDVNPEWKKRREKLRKWGQETFLNFEKTIRAISKFKDTPQEYIERHVRPEVARALGLKTIDWQAHADADVAARAGETPAEGSSQRGVWQTIKRLVGAGLAKLKETFSEESARQARVKRALRKAVFPKHPTNKRRKMRKPDMPVRALYQFVRQHPEFPLQMVRRKLAPGEMLIRQGDAGQFLFVLLELSKPLQVETVAEVCDGDSCRRCEVENLNRIARPTILGENSVEGRAATATVRALRPDEEGGDEEPTELLMIMIPRDQFTDVMKFPMFRKALIKIRRDRLGNIERRIAGFAQREKDDAMDGIARLIQQITGESGTPVTDESAQRESLARLRDMAKAYMGETHRPQENRAAVADVARNIGEMQDFAAHGLDSDVSKEDSQPLAFVGPASAEQPSRQMH